MRKITTLLIVLISITSSSCIGALNNAEKGNSNIKSKEFSISDYSSIKGNGSADFYYEQQPNKAPYLRIEIDENLLEYIEVKTDNNTLTVKSTQNINPTKYTIYTNSKSLVRASMNGSGDLYLNGDIKTNELDISLHGSGDMSSQNIQSDNITVSIKGSGNVLLKGRTNKLECSIQGSGDIKADQLQSKDAECAIFGSGNISVNASNSLAAKIHGSGDIAYTGSPVTIDKSIKGSGSIRKK